MARVTVEDCIEVIPNRYELVLMAAQRARDIAAGASISISRDNDKNPVVALREIADRSIDLNQVRDHIVNGVNRMGDLNEEDDLLLAIAGQGVAEEAPAEGAVIEEVSFDGGAAISAAEEEMGDDFEGLVDGEVDFSTGLPDGFQEDMGAGDFGSEER